jgi:molecular chaperone DnaK (HSP70)
VIDIENFHDGNDFSEKLTRAKFEELNADLFRQTIQCVDAVLKDKGLSPDNIDDIILVGGSTRIPRIQQLVRDYFHGKEPERSVNADEAVALGAAIHAAQLSLSEKTDDAILLNVNPLSLGIGTYQGVVEVLIPRNSRVPARKSRNFTTVMDEQTSVLVTVYEGEKESVDDCHFLGNFLLEGIQVAAKGTPSIEVTFELNMDGILVVSAIDMNTQVRGEIQIQGAHRLSDQQLNDAIEQEGAGNKYGDRSRTSCGVLATRLEGLKLELANRGRPLSGAVKTELTKALKKGHDWLVAHRDASPGMCQQELDELNDMFIVLEHPGAREDDSL